MKNLSKAIVRSIERFLYGENFSNINELMLLKIIFFQKILGFNRRIPWPVHWTSQIIGVENITIGTRTPGLSMSCFLDGRNGIILGDNVWVGPRVSLISQDHDSLDYKNYVKDRPIIIKKNSLLAANSIILPGVKLGPHTIVAAGAVVTKSFPEGNQVLAGCPAVVVKKIESYGNLKCAE